MDLCCWGLYPLYRSQSGCNTTATGSSTSEHFVIIISPSLRNYTLCSFWDARCDHPIRALSVAMTSFVLQTCWVPLALHPDMARMLCHTALGPRKFCVDYDSGCGAKIGDFYSHTYKGRRQGEKSYSFLRWKAIGHDLPDAHDTKVQVLKGNSLTFRINVRKEMFHYILIGFLTLSKK
jgi:hypothetical protein